MSDLLPSLRALRAFISVADRGGVRRAAEALNLSEAAVSHQLKNLETHLGQRLFEKDGRGLRLTDLGQKYLDLVTEPIAELRKASEVVSSRRVARQVTLTLAPTLASHWLIPELVDFEHDFPNLSLHLITTTQIIDLDRYDVDIAIRYLQCNNTPSSAKVVYSETAFPVCSPEYQIEKNYLSGIADGLSLSRFLVNDTHPDEWNWWLTTHQKAISLPKESKRFETSHMTMEAAAYGYGIAMGRRPIVDSYLSSGRLIAPFGSKFETGYQYVILSRAGETRGDISLVIDWIASRFKCLEK